LSRKPRAQRKRPRRTKLADRAECGDNGALKMSRMMNDLRGELTTANLLLVAFMFIAQAPSTTYDILRLDTPPGFDVFYSFGMLYVIGHWLEVDNRKYNFRWPFCRGVFLQVTAFFIIPYYLFKTRGKYAFLTLFIFLCLWLLTTFAGAVVAALLIGSRFE
jgi:hypothetical protein